MTNLYNKNKREKYLNEQRWYYHRHAMNVLKKKKKKSPQDNQLQYKVN